jgi:hypothetical protein
MIDWQLVIVWAVVIASASLLLRRVLRWFRGQPSGCSQCSRQKESPQSIKLKPLTQISLRNDPK